MSKYTTVTINNPLEEDFVFEFNDADGTEEIVIPANGKLNLPEPVAREGAYYLAQKLLDKEGKTFFGKEHKEKIEELLKGDVEAEVVRVVSKGKKTKEVEAMDAETVVQDTTETKAVENF